MFQFFGQKDCTKVKEPARHVNVLYTFNLGPASTRLPLFTTKTSTYVILNTFIMFKINKLRWTWICYRFCNSPPDASILCTLSLSPITKWNIQFSNFTLLWLALKFHSYFNEPAVRGKIIQIWNCITPFLKLWERYFEYFPS